MGCCASIDTTDHPLPKKRSTLEENKGATQNGSRTNSGVEQVKTLQDKQQSKVPKLDLTKAVSNAASTNVPKKTNSAMKTDANQETPEQSVVVNNNATVKQPTVKEPEVVKQQVQQADIVATQVRTSSAENNAKINVAHNIFVSLKKGLITDYYKVGKTLGEGAYGKVYQVQHRTTGLIRAMKAIKKKSVLKEEQEKLFSEVSILKDLDHPNIVKLYELYQDEGYYYLITEFCTGGEFFDRIQAMHSFTEKIAADYMKQILSAVVYCHDKNIVHRDLKPENLLLDSKSLDARLKVIDFGTSKKFVSGAKMNQKFGTAYYIAPEVLNKDYDEKCDIWSCGVILYILLCGYPPFGGANDRDILNKVKIGKYKFDEDDWGKISYDAKNLIRKMLTFNPADRISAREALNDKWIQNNTIGAPLNQKALRNLADFSSRNKLKQAILTFIVTQMTSQSEKDELQKTFQTLDRDSNGVLTKDELIEGYKKVFAERANPELEVQRIIEEVDINNSGQIDFTEFIIATMNKEKLLTQNKLEQAFHLFDQDGDGFITRFELANVMGGIELDDAQWKSLVEECDTNKDGKISKEEFMDLLLKMA
jgi:calcium-dependent protein kinase